jgi:hypothetical protein
LTFQICLRAPFEMNQVGSCTHNLLMEKLRHTGCEGLSYYQLGFGVQVVPPVSCWVESYLSALK